MQDFFYSPGRIRGKKTTSRMVVSLVQKREEARKAKNWAEADYCRDQILQQGYIILDAPDGPKLKKISLKVPLVFCFG